MRAVDNKVTTLVDAATPARQAFVAGAINIVAWLPDTGEFLKWLGVITAIVALIVQIQSVRLKSLEIKRVKEALENDEP